MRFLIRTVTNAFALWIAVLIVPGINLVGEIAPGDFLGTLDPAVQQVIYYLLAGAVLAAVNSIVRPLVKFLSLPLYLITFGLFFLIVNALMLWITSWVTGYLDMGIAIDNFWWAILGGIVIAVVNTIIEALIPEAGDLD